MKRKARNASSTPEPNAYSSESSDGQNGSMPICCARSGNRPLSGMTLGMSVLHARGGRSKFATQKLRRGEKRKSLPSRSLASSLSQIQLFGCAAASSAGISARRTASMRWMLSGVAGQWLVAERWDLFSGHDQVEDGELHGIEDLVRHGVLIEEPLDEHAVEDREHHRGEMIGGHRFGEVALRHALFDHDLDRRAVTAIHALEPLLHVLVRVGRFQQ